jgi:hypothetical protein
MACVGITQLNWLCVASKTSLCGRAVPKRLRQLHPSMRTIYNCHRKMATHNAGRAFLPIAWTAAHMIDWLGRSVEFPVIIDGDAHLNNFGFYGTPQREVVLELNDFDEVTMVPRSGI